MLPAHTAAQVRSAEAPVLAVVGEALMERAAFALAMTVLGELRRRRGRVRGASAVLLVGAGNNGGDALHAGAHLARRGVSVLAVATAAQIHPSGLAALTRAGGRVVSLLDGGPGEPAWLGDAVAEAFTADVVLDALVGIGGRGALRGEAGRIVAVLSALISSDDAGSPLVVAVDLPSGIGVDDGVVPGPVLPADLTVTFGAAKPGLLLPPARALAGRVHVIDLGLGPALAALGEPGVVRLDEADLAGLWPIPGTRADKYSRGVLGVVAGSERYPGAAVLATGAAVRTGVGMVRYVGPRTTAAAVLAARPEVVAADGRVQAWVLGPGVDGEDVELAGRVAEALAGVLGDNPVPAVVDAGALDLLPARCAPHLVLTPHAGELARLLTVRGHPVERAEVAAEPLRCARLAAELTGATVLLKGSTTVIVSPDGAAYAQDSGPAWLATAGAGDVLAGVLGALLAGHGPRVVEEPGLAARLAAAAVVVHGRAAGRAAEHIGDRSSRPVARTTTEPDLRGELPRLGPIAASDVVDALPTTIGELLSWRRR